MSSVQIGVRVYDAEIYLVREQPEDVYNTIEQRRVPIHFRHYTPEEILIIIVHRLKIN